MFAALALLASLLGLFTPASAAETGILKVRSSVEAEVYVDGALLGKTPLTKYLAVGAHQLRVVADNYDPFVRKIDVAADKTADVQATLVAGAGTVEFSGPPGARLSLDGSDRGPLPIRIPDPGAGKHTWRVEAPKFEPGEGSFEFARGKNILVDVKLPSSRGIFIVESTPAGATVRIDGKEVGTTPLRLTDVEPGKHAVHLTHPELGTVFRTADTTDGSRGEVKASFPKNGAVLDLTTNSADAIVLVDGAQVAAGTHVEIGPLEKGRLKLEIHIGDRKIIDTVSLPARGKLALRVAGDVLIERKPLTQRWGFWAAIGGVAVAGGATGVAVAVANAPEPPPVGDTVVVLP